MHEITFTKWIFHSLNVFCDPFWHFVHKINQMQPSDFVKYDLFLIEYWMLNWFNNAVSLDLQVQTAQTNKCSYEGHMHVFFSPLLMCSPNPAIL